jgi:ParB family chromosome partitioning protein
MTTTYQGASRSDGFTGDPSIFTIITDKEHPLYDERIEIPLDNKKLAALVESIYEYGVKKQIHVLRDGDKLLVKDGNQRVRAAIEANKRRKASGFDPIQVPFKVVRDADGESQSEKATMNIHVSSPPMMTARLALRLEKDGRSREQIAVALGCTATMVENYLKLFDCAPVVQKAVEQEKASPSVARELSKLPRDEQEKALETMLAAGVTKGSAGMRAVSAAKRGEKIEKKANARRMKNRVWTQEVYDRLNAREGSLKKDTREAVLPLLRMLLGYKGAEKDLSDDVAEVVSEMAEAKKPRGKKAPRSAV